MSSKISRERYKEVKGFRPDDFNDTDYIERVIKVLGISERNLLLIWVSHDYEDYLELKWNDYTKRKAEIDIAYENAKNKKVNNTLATIGDLIIQIGEQIKKLNGEYK